MLLCSRKSEKANQRFLLGKSVWNWTRLWLQHVHFLPETSIFNGIIGWYRCDIYVPNGFSNYSIHTCKTADISYSIWFVTQKNLLKKWTSSKISSSLLQHIFISFKIQHEFPRWGSFFNNKVWCDISRENFSLFILSTSSLLC